MNEDFQDKNERRSESEGGGRYSGGSFQGRRDGRNFNAGSAPYPRRDGRHDGGFEHRAGGGYGHSGYRRPQNGGSGYGSRPYEGNREPRPYASREFGLRRNEFGPRYPRQEGRGGFEPHRNGQQQSYGDRPWGQNSRYGNERQAFQSRRPAFNRPAGGQGGEETPYSNANRGDGFRTQRPFKPYTKYSNKKRLAYQEKHFDPNEPVRLNKYLANAGICSRRDADKYIAAGVVTVNGKIVTELGAKVLRSDTVLFHDTLVKMEKEVHVLLNTPKGSVTTSEGAQCRRTVMDLVKDACTERIYPVGRLDRNTTGVLLLTNDGELASKLTHPKYLKKKIYHVHTDRNVSAADLQQIVDGITLEDGEIKADAAAYASDTDKKQVGIEIHSGKNRIVRRIFEHLGYHVLKLDRVYFAGLTKKGLRRGDWRFLSEKEVAMLRMGAFE